MRVFLQDYVRAVSDNNYICLISCLTGVADKNNVVNSLLGLAPLANVSMLALKPTTPVVRRRTVEEMATLQEKRAGVL